ncbi:MAG: 5-(carboxyamino)imidazole ribonucleotide mutase [Acidobacteriota bacterium]
MTEPTVAVVMGSLSDLELMLEGIRVLHQYGVSTEVRILSAHRHPEAVAEFGSQASQRGLRVLIAGAGGAAHLAGTLAAHSSLPVIGVPLVASALSGLDALLATVQMPAGVPVATMGIGRSGAVNAAHLAVRVLALEDVELARRVDRNREAQKEKVEKQGEELSRYLAEKGLA